MSLSNHESAHGSCAGCGRPASHNHGSMALCEQCVRTAAVELLPLGALNEMYDARDSDLPRAKRTRHARSVLSVSFPVASVGTVRFSLGAHKSMGTPETVRWNIVNGELLFTPASCGIPVRYRGDRVGITGDGRYIRRRMRALGFTPRDGMAATWDGEFLRVRLS